MLIESVFVLFSKIEFKFVGLDANYRCKFFLNNSYQVNWKSMIGFWQILMQEAEVKEDRETDRDEDAIQDPKQKNNLQCKGEAIRGCP